MWAPDWPTQNRRDGWQGSTSNRAELSALTSAAASRSKLLSQLCERGTCMHHVTHDEQTIASKASACRFERFMERAHIRTLQME